MGSVPDWYQLIHASRYLGIPAPELALMPNQWITWAREAENAELFAANEQRRLQKG